MKKVFFVGMHNKSEMKPLDSKTKSGKLIDRIIKHIDPAKYQCVKTNLCEVEYQPLDGDEIQDHNRYWLEKYDPRKGDVVILLGTWTRVNFLLSIQSKIIKLQHPSLQYSHTKMTEYVDGALKQIFS